MLELPQLRRRIDTAADLSLLTALRAAGVPVAHSCAGQGVCGSCRLYVEGELPEFSLREIRLRAKQGHAADPSARYSCLLRTPDPSKTWVIRSDYW